MRQYWLFASCLVISCAGKSTRPDSTEVQQAGAPSITGVTNLRSDGGPVVTNLGYGIKVNSGSSLHREWLTFTDSLLPARFVDSVGVRTVFESGGYSGDYKYSAVVPIHTSAPLSAVEVRFVLFDLWGDFVKTLSMTEVQDIPADTTITFSAKWALYSENEASEHYASLAYIARVRSRDGKIFEARQEPIVAEAQKFSKKFTPEDLDPDRRPARDSTSHK
jgi:hypothetical protein